MRRSVPLTWGPWTFGPFGLAAAGDREGFANDRAAAVMLQPRPHEAPSVFW
jgi:hypothetical protein